MAALRWDGDERGEGIADATPFAAGALELVDAMRLATWVAEQPESHIQPHLERACRSLPLRLEHARSATDGAFEVSLYWTGETPGVGEVRAAVFSLAGSFAELSTYVRQRRIEETGRRQDPLVRDRHRLPRRRESLRPAWAHRAGACLRARVAPRLTRRARRHGFASESSGHGRRTGT